MKRNLSLVIVFLVCTLAVTSSAAAVDFSVTWNKTYGGPDANDSAYALLPNPDGKGYLFAGDTGSFGVGERDAWVVNLTGTGDERWNRTFDAGEADAARALVNTTDGNYLFAGSLTQATGGTRKDTGTRVVMFDPLGGIIWNTTFGGADINASAYAAAKTRDGGYVVAGTVTPPGSSATDILVIKINATGGEVWNRTFGEPGSSDAAYSVIETTDGNIAVAGSTESFGAFAIDAWVAKLDPAGTPVWNTTFGGPGNDTARALAAAPDGALVFAGSYMRRDAANRTENDALVVRMGPDGKVVWNRTYGDAGTNESAESIIATTDGGYLFVGERGKDPAGGDAWVVKLDGVGGVKGSMTLGGVNPGDRAASAVQVSNTEYAFAGTFNATGKGGPVDTDAWVVKFTITPRAVSKASSKSSSLPANCPTPTNPEPTPTVARSSLGDFVWNDTNADGIQDPGEPGIEGVNVALLDADLCEVAATKTGADGRYHFACLTPGDYAVKFVPPAGMVFTRQGAGDDDACDSDADQTTGRTETITLKAGEKRDWWDAGFIVLQPEITGSVDGFVWVDANEDGIQDGDETGLLRASVTLYHTNGTPVDATTTDAAGRYLFTGLPPGDYYLVFGLPQGYTFTAACQGSDDTLDSDADPATGRTGNIKLTGTEVTRDAGVVVEAPPSGEPGIVTGIAWLDIEANGVKDNDDPASSGIRVELMSAGGVPVDSTITGDDGVYTFCVDEPGCYSLRFAPPKQFKVIFVTPGSGSDVDPETGTTDTFDVVPSETVTRDAGLVRGGRSFSGEVWYDLNANGIRDPGDPGVPSIRIHLLSTKPSLIGGTVTDSNGSYQFPTSGAYYWGYGGVEYLLPSGYSCTVPGLDSAARIYGDVARADLGTEGFEEPGGETLNAGLVGEYQTETPAAAYGWVYGTTWSDDDEDGVWDHGEGGMADVEVRLLDADGAVVASARTRDAAYFAGATYLFGPLLPGEYSLAFIPPENYVLTDPGEDSRVDPVTGMTDPFTVSGDDTIVRDAGMYYMLLPGFATGTVWNDTNADGVWDAGEPVLPGVCVDLMNPDGTLSSSTITGDDGEYTFSVSAYRRYFLQFMTPEGFDFTVPGSGSDVDPEAGTTDRFDVAPSGTLTRNAGLVSAAPCETPVTPGETPVTPDETPVTPCETSVTPNETPVTLDESPVPPEEAKAGEEV